jgi:hypothetical protein
MLQVMFTSRNDCILAETYMRLDHLESAMHNVRHEELINGIMMRLDHLSTDIDHIREHADDKIEENRKQAEFKQMVSFYPRPHCSAWHRFCPVARATVQVSGVLIDAGALLM